jgi:uncharacterized protein (DUF305 family)
MIKVALIAVSALFIAAGAASGEEVQTTAHRHAEHAGMDMGTTSAETPSTQAFKSADQKMHANMAASFTGNADIDFVKGMIPHHQGAIDMAKVELQYGKDPEIRKLAEGVIKAQEGEIGEMTAWLANHQQK